MKGIKFSIPYNPVYSTPPTTVSKTKIEEAITAAKKTPESIEFDMILAIVKSERPPSIRHVTAHILDAANALSGHDPKGVFIEHKKSLENIIEIHADDTSFSANSKPHHELTQTKER